MLIYVLSKIPFVSLRVKLVILITLPMFITLAGLSYYQYYREQQTLLKQLDDIAYNFGEVIVGSLRHTMLERDPAMTTMVLNEIGSQSSILHTALYNSKSELVATNAADYFGDADRSSPGCVECHQNGNKEGFRSLVIQTPTGGDVLRTDIPIRNEPECYSCHSKDGEVLGVLVIDYSVTVRFRPRLLSYGVYSDSGLESIIFHPNIVGQGPPLGAGVHLLSEDFEVIEKMV